MREPEVPVSVRVALPIVAVGAAVIVTVCAAPGVRVRVAGCAVTPVGSPEMVTITAPMKPLSGAALMLICWAVPPALSETAEGESDKEKSACGAGVDEPPQELRTRQKRVIEHAVRTLENGLMPSLPAFNYPQVQLRS